MNRQGKLERELAALDTMSRSDLSACWQKQYGCPPPDGMRRDLLLRSAGWHLQAKHLGGYSAETRRRLKSAKTEVSEALARRRNPPSTGAVANEGVDITRRAADPKSKRREVRPGARLIRDWNGKAYVVDVIEGGYVFEAKVYRSLTAIAGKITGAHWSGPRFFGL
ncbi:hypothetical protein Amn_51140 [Aminobacter sp. Y103A]|uniref:DUF2924 domain-containing protein n=1 Tax=Aminobacter sp. Y103A TaxID=1870862 RepID=UPI002573934B|nr:DUF2924 domain-containing protein [Aminobacter sp. SS-2016]BBD40234.1 hypothetical protein Amn_51140 [Aminobacter sp. SS-2016]